MAKPPSDIRIIDFLGIGAQKAGTTWLYEQLKHQDEIFFPPQKEVHFFDMFEERGIDWYESLFKGAGDKIKGEITPAYAILPLAKIAEIKKLNPDLKIIFIHRNPIERAWSAALMDMERAGIKFEDAEEEWFVNHFSSEGSLRRGDYEACLKNWLSIFPRKQILILNYEDLKTRPQALLKGVFSHLGIKKGEIPESLNEKIFAGKHHSLPPNLKRELERIYLNKILSFEKFLIKN